MGVSGRLPDDLHRELELADVGEFVRDDLMRVALELRSKRKMETLAKHRQPARRPVTDLVREARDH